MSKLRLLKNISIGVCAVLVLSVLAIKGVRSAQAVQMSRSSAPLVSDYLRTVKHDGHLFVIHARSYTAAIHHPDCPCEADRKEVP